MDIVSHTLTGVAVGTVIATLSRRGWKQKTSIILIAGFGGALPDLDAISLWSRFDSTIGSFLNLTHTGKQIYSGKFWYSHHAALHSISAPILLIFVSIFFTSFYRRKQKKMNLKKDFLKKKLLFFAFFFGFLFHLLEDLPTSASSWGGVNLFFPLDNYIGGYGKIWWWNNYDLFLIICSVVILNLLINFASKKYKKIKFKASISLFILGLTLGIYQIKTRPFDFNSRGKSNTYQSLEIKSKHIQKEILGERVFQIMTEIDNKIPLNF